MIKLKKIQKSILNNYNNFFNTSQSLLSPLLLLASRLWIANVFFKSGRNKFANMDSTIYLFEYEYNIPILSPVVAAYSGTFFELVCPIFIALGLFSRLAAIPLIIMTCVIQFLVVHNIEHFYWLFLLISIFTYGSDKLSVDKILKIK